MDLGTAPVLELEDLLNAPANTSAEVINDDWDRELTPLVEANADVIVRCPWQDDKEMTLSAAMNSIIYQVTRENVDMVVAEVHMMLANRVEEQAEEDNEETLNSNLLQPNVPALEVIKKPALDTQIKKSTPEIAAITEVVEARPGETPLKEKPAAKSEDLIGEQTEVIVETAQPTSELYIEEVIIKNFEATDLVAEFDELDDSLPLDEVDIIEVPELDIDKTAIEVAPTSDLEPEVNELIINEAPAIDLAEPQATVLKIEELNLPEQGEASTELTEVEAFDVLVDEITQTEDTLNLLVEKIETCDPEDLNKVCEILDKIIEIPATLEFAEMDETQAQEELESLLIELFEVLEIDYTPQLIEALAKSILDWNLAAELEDIADHNKEAAPSTRNDAVVKQLTGLKYLIISLPKAQAIGKKIMKLYRLSLLNASFSSGF